MKTKLMITVIFVFAYISINNALAETPKIGSVIKGPLPGMEFAYIPHRTFIMGSVENEPDRFDEKKLHKVKLTQGIYMQTTELTQG